MENSKLKFVHTSKVFFLKNPMLFVVVLIFIAASIFVPQFASFYNIRDVLLQTSDLIIVSCGVTFIVLNGGIDFSATSILALSSVIGTTIMTKGSLAGSTAGIIVGMIVMILVGAIMGAFNGIAIVKLKMPSFIVTLATMMIGSGAAIWYTNSQTINGLPKTFLEIGNGSVLFIPIPVIISAIVIAATHFILKYTKFGRQVYAVGTNPKTALISGMPVKTIIFKMCLISGTCAGIASIVMSARNQVGMPTLGNLMFIDIIASIVIGGTSVFGGVGGVIGTLYGVLFITLMNNCLNLIGVPWYVISIVKGAIVIFAAFMDSISKQLSEK